MADPYAAIAQIDPFVQKRLAEVLELRAADPQQQTMLREYLSQIELPRGARALEIGCGTGSVCRALVEMLKIEVLGVDPSPVFISRAGELGHHLNGLTFAEDDGRSLDLPTPRSIWCCFTPRCRTSPSQSWPCARHIGSCSRMAG